MNERVHLKIRGIVQGVGFRPFLHRTARACRLTGWGKNTSGGVEVQVEGTHEAIEAFIQKLKTSPPPMACIEELSVQTIPPLENESDFVILQSQSLSESTLISPDIATCRDCERELFTPSDRRYQYPFINCTNCGPRFTIIRDLPYDRTKTVMADFTMCPRCDREYHDISDRRYHAQPDCCPDCGPKVFFLDSKGQPVPGDPLAQARKYLSQGKIIAVKGIGGIHLACDALNSQATALLRQRKRRPEKPLALMAASVSEAKKICYVSPKEEALLTGSARPIVLLKRKAPDRPEGISFSNRLGVMLPYTPVHLLLFGENSPRILVMTSANSSGCPVLTDNERALDVLSGIADGYLLNNRPIENRCDDSVVMVSGETNCFFRRSRGYAPGPLTFPGQDFSGICAFGAEQKGSFALGRDAHVFLSPYIGDLKNMETFDHYLSMKKTYARLFKIKPKLLVCDRHPDYFSSREAREITAKDHLPLISVWHHHSHMASCMAENGLNEKVFALVWDGTGLGADGTIWGAECLKGDFKTCDRAGSIRPVVLPGGDKAVQEIGRIAISLLRDSGLSVEPAPLPAGKAKLIAAMLDQNVSCPQASSMGRLFDGVGALLTGLDRISFDGEGAMKVEALADRDPDFKKNDTAPYPMDFYMDQGVRRFDTRGLIRGIMDDLYRQIPPSIIARRFMETLCHMALDQTLTLNPEHLPVVLSGGVFQNAWLLSGIKQLLTLYGFQVYTHNRVSPGDEGLSLGQVFIAKAQLKKGGF